MRSRLLLLTLITSLAAAFPAYALDVHDASVASSSNFIQTGPGAPAVDPAQPFSVIARLTAATPASVLSVTLSSNTLVNLPLSHLPGSPLWPHVESFPTLAALRAAHPDGTQYDFSVNTLNDGPHVISTFLNPVVYTYPDAPHITNFTALQTIDPGASFDITRDPFSIAPDPNTPDLFLSHIDILDSAGYTLTSFDTFKFLTVPIPAGLLAPNQDYTLVFSDVWYFQGGRGAYINPGSSFQTATTLTIHTNPEPATFGLFSLAAIPLLRRRR